MEAKPKPFNVKLTDAERLKLEEHRRRLGLKSNAEVLRYWINQDFAPDSAAVRARAADLARGARPDRLTMKDIRGDFQTRLKPDKGAKR